MKKLSLSAVFLFLILLTSNICPQTLNEIIDYQFDAVKQDKFNLLKTIIIESKIKNIQGQGTQVIYHKRPKMIRIERNLPGEKYIIVFNGKEGWKISNGNRTEKLSGKIFDDIKFRADLDGYFFCFREKGHDLKYEGKERLNGKQYFKIKCTKQNGDEADLYLDASDYLLNKVVKRIKYPEGLRETETVINNYKKVNGIPFAHKYVTASGGKNETETVTKIVLDKPIEDRMFELPAPPRK